MRIFFIGLVAACGVLAAGLYWQPITLPTVWLQWGGVRPVAEPSEPSGVVFTGDVFLGRAVERWLADNPGRTPLRAIDGLLAPYQHRIINFESAIPERHQPTPDFGFQFSTASTALRHLRASGVSHASVANNHTYDFGTTGYHHTIATLRAASIPPLQSNAVPTYLRVAEELVAVFAVTTVGVNVDESELAAAIDAVPATAAHTVVYIHWGEEYQIEPSPQQRELAATLAAAGATLIIGHHPHVIQTIERIDNTLVIYSLGNTVFDQYFSEAVQTGLLAGLTYTNEQWSVRLHPISSLTTRHQPQPLVGTAREQTLADIAVRSQPELAEAIRRGRLDLQ